MRLRLLISCMFALSGSGMAQFLPDTIFTTPVGSTRRGMTTTYTGYDPSQAQGVVLGGRIPSETADLLLLGNSYARGLVVVPANSADSVLQAFDSLTSTQKYVPVPGADTITTDLIGGMATLRPMSGTAQSAIVALLTTRYLMVYEIRYDGTSFTASRLSLSDLPDDLTQSSSYAYNDKRLALLGTSTSSGSTLYHLAASNPRWTRGTDANTGRVDFLTLDGSSWGLLQPNTTGITSASFPSMYALNAETRFGTGLASLGDVDGDGVPDLAVMAPRSSQYPYSALFVFRMANASTPKDEIPTVWNSSSAPWALDPRTIPDADTTAAYQNSPSIGSTDLDGDGKPELLVVTAVPLTVTYGRAHVLRAFHFDSSSHIARAEFLGSLPLYLYTSVTGMGPLATWNREVSAPRFHLTQLSSYASSASSLLTFLTQPLDLVRTFQLEAGADRVQLVDADSLFGRPGYTKYSYRTLSGLVDCESSDRYASCKAPAEAANTWSTVLISPTSGSCSTSVRCKTQDTLHIHVRPAGSTAASAHRLSEVVLTPGSPLELGKLRSQVFDPAYPGDLKRSELSIAPGTSVAASDSFGNWTLHASDPGIDTLTLTLTADSLTNLPLVVHVVPDSLLVTGAIPPTPGNDTLWGVDSSLHYALPGADTAGDAYTYDIAQDSTFAATISGAWLHGLKANGDSGAVTLRYVAAKEIRTRSIVLRSVAKPVSIGAQRSGVQPLVLIPTARGIRIQGTSGSCYTFEVLSPTGRLLSRQAGTLHGSSTLLPIPGNGLRLVHVRMDSQSAWARFID